jgi:hypothetical protein
MWHGPHGRPVLGAKAEMRAIGRVDLAAYVRALPLYARHPWLMAAPLLMSLAGALLLILVPSSGGTIGSLTGGLTALFINLLDSFGLAVSLIIAERAWRMGSAPFDDAWADARRKAPDILMAALGFNVVLYVAGLVGGFLGSIGALALTALAAYFFIYAVPAAAIGGVPGGAALQVSLERVQRSYANTFLLGVVFVAFTTLFPTVWGFVAVQLASGPSFLQSTAAIDVVGAVIKAIGIGYLALVMAKAYEDASAWRRY